MTEPYFMRWTSPGGPGERVDPATLPIAMQLDLARDILHHRIDRASHQASRSVHELIGTYHALPSWYWYDTQHKAKRIADHRAALLREFPERQRLITRAIMKGQQ